MLLSSPLFQDPKRHSCGPGEMCSLVPCMHLEWQVEIYIMLSRILASVQIPVETAKLRGRNVVQKVSAITQFYEKVFNSKTDHIPGPSKEEYDYF